jgi:hypothetical protein
VTDGMTRALGHRLRTTVRLATVSATILVAACLDRLGGPDALRPGAALSVVEENLRLGARDWDAQLFASADSIMAGFGLPSSLGAGDTLHLFVTVQRAPVTVSVYRLGWYRGDGARLIARHVRVPARLEPSCSAPSPGPAVCGWPETDQFVVGREWPPGVYVARFSDALEQAAAAPFVVRSSRPTPFVVVLPFATYQAYSDWGGASLYGGAGTTGAEAYANRAVKVSFARPLSVHALRSHLLGLDYPLVRWLEQNGYDVSYLTDYDFHLGRGPDPSVAWLFAGHSEYWSWPMWLRANAGRAQGIGLGFLGGNAIHWLVRFESVSVQGRDAPVVVCYRDATRDPLGATPGLATVRFRSPPNNTPENAVIGTMTPRHALMQHVPIDLVVADASDPLLRGTGLATGQHIPRVAGWEGDRIVDNGATPPGIRVLFDSPFVPVGDTTPSGLMQATVYTWQPSGAMVYASGEPGFAWGLATYQRFVARPPLERFLQNVLTAFVAARSRN